MRVLKLRADNNVETVSFKVPRTRAEYFQDDLFPPTRDTQNAVCKSPIQTLTLTFVHGHISTMLPATLSIFNVSEVTPFYPLRGFIFPHMLGFITRCLQRRSGLRARRARLSQRACSPRAWWRCRRRAPTLIPTRTRV